MNRALVRLLIWFFIAALPLQGYAAAVRACCGQMQPGAMRDQSQGVGVSGTLQADGMPQVSHAAMPMDAVAAMPPAGGSAKSHGAAAHCAAMAAQAGDVHSADSASSVAASGAHARLAADALLAADAVQATHPAHASSSTSTVHTASPCSACAASCIAAWSAMPVTLAVTPILFSSVKIVLAPVPMVSGHIPAGLERPPRLTFAV